MGNFLNQTDDRPTDQPSELGRAAERSDESLSAFVPRAGEGEGERVGGSVQAVVVLPPVKDTVGLMRAAADMVEFGIALEVAAATHGVNPDTLHVYYRTYVNFVGKDNVAEIKVGDGVAEFDRSSARQFDRNWAEMMYQAEKSRPQLSPMRRALVGSPFTSWLFRGDTLDKIALSGAIFVVLLVFLAVRLTTADRGVAQSEDEEVAVSERQLGNNVFKLEPEQQRDLLTELVGAMEEFLNLKTWRERLPYVRNGEKLEPLMEAYYAKNPDGLIGPVMIEPDMSFIERPEGQFALVQGVRTFPDGPNRPLILLVEICETEPEFLFDWEVMVNYEPVPWDEFKESRHQEPAPFRIRVAEGDYYNQPFLDQEKYVGFRLYLFDRTDELFGYVRRDSEIARVIEKALDPELDGERAMILNLRYPEGAKFDNIVEIESIAAEYW